VPLLTIGFPSDQNQSNVDDDPVTSESPN
jgi:hypothetical protein